MRVMTSPTTILGSPVYLGSNKCMILWPPNQGPYRNTVLGQYWTVRSACTNFSNNFQFLLRGIQSLPGGPCVIQSIRRLRCMWHLMQWKRIIVIITSGSGTQETYHCWWWFSQTPPMARQFMDCSSCRRAKSPELGRGEVVRGFRSCRTQARQDTRAHQDRYPRQS